MPAKKAQHTNPATNCKDLKRKDVRQYCQPLISGPEQQPGNYYNYTTYHLHTKLAQLWQKRLI